MATKITFHDASHATAVLKALSPIVYADKHVKRSIDVIHFAPGLTGGVTCRATDGHRMTEVWLSAPIATLHGDGPGVLALSRLKLGLAMAKDAASNKAGVTLELVDGADYGFPETDAIWPKLKETSQNHVMTAFSPEYLSQLGSTYAAFRKGFPGCEHITIRLGDERTPLVAQCQGVGEATFRHCLMPVRMTEGEEKRARDARRNSEFDAAPSVSVGA